MSNSHGIPVTYEGSLQFFAVGNLTDVFIEKRKIKADCGADGFKYGEVLTSEWISVSGGTRVNLLEIESENLTTNLDVVWYEEQPCTNDGRLIIRSDTRPINTETYFTMAGDSTSNIGNGKELRWDFSNNDDLYTGSEVPSGYKAKEMKLKFLCPVYLKDGTIYFFDAPWGQYVMMDIVVPAGGYYPNPAGQIPAYMLGLSGNKMYAQAVADTPYQRYVNKHFLYGDCPIGDELNAEGSAIEALPIGWYLRGLIITPESDNISKGYSSLEMYRCHTILLPGQSNPHE